MYAKGEYEMKRLCVLLVGLFILTGCSLKEEDTTAPTLELSKTRIQIAVNGKVDYLSYVQVAKDDVDGDLKEAVTYNEIDTSKIGSQEIIYTLLDKADNKTTQSMNVDVVEFYEGGIFDPTKVNADTVSNPEDVTVLVNKLHQIPEGWTPDDLQPVIDNANQKLRKEANDAYTKFYNAAKAKGIAIYSISGYRTNATQTTYWNNMNKVYGNEYASQYSAYPGRSEHQLGLAIDVSFKTDGDRLSEKVASSEIGKFIESDGYKYGFILRYPQDKVAITNYGYEPWHIRYVGVELATKLHEEHLTLEEYYKQ